MELIKNIFIIITMIMANIVMILSVIALIGTFIEMYKHFKGGE